METGSRIYGFDILRSMAILFVLYSHGVFILAPFINTNIYNVFALDGVSMFFVLSGFLIGGILLKIISQTSFSTKDLLQFWIRRWFRTLPTYFLVLSTLILYFYFQGIFHLSGPATLKYFFFLQNFNSPHPNFFPEVWSLSVEEWFYVLIPLLLFISFHLKKISKQKIVLFWVITIILGINIFRIYTMGTTDFTSFHDWDMEIKKQVLMRLDSLMLGFFGAYVYYFHPQKWLKQKNVLFVSGILLLLYPQIQVFFSSNIWYTQNYFSLLFTAIGTLFLLPKLSQIHQSQSWVYVFFTGISKISYSMYLLHFTIIQWILLPFLSKQFYILEGRDLATALEKYILYCVLTIGLSFLLYKYFEKPMTQLRERFSFTHNNKH